MKKLIFLLIFEIGFAGLHAQLLDNELHAYKKQIIDSLINFGQITDPAHVGYSHYDDELVSTNLFHQKGCSFFVIGINSAHSMRYLSWLSGGKMSILRTVDFSSDFPKIISVMKSTVSDSAKPSKIIEFLEQIEGLYRYNQNPPWKKDL